MPKSILEYTIYFLVKHVIISDMNPNPIIKVVVKLKNKRNCETSKLNIGKFICIDILSRPPCINLELTATPSLHKTASKHLVHAPSLNF